MDRGDPAGLSAAHGRKFALTLGSAFLVIAGMAWWRGGSTVPLVLAAGSGVLLVCAVLVPHRLGPVHRAWMGLALLLSKLTTPVFMALIFYLVFLPVGLSIRLLGHNPLARDPSDHSFWRDRPENASGSDLRHQF